MGTELYHQACKVETCEEKRSGCASLATFAESCKHAGYCIDWRTDNCSKFRRYEAILTTLLVAVVLLVNNYFTYCSLQITPHFQLKNLRKFLL